MKTLRSKFNERREVAMRKSANNSHEKKMVVNLKELNLKDAGVL